MNIVLLIFKDNYKLLLLFLFSIIIE